MEILDASKLKLAEYNKLGKTIRTLVEEKKPLDYFVEEYNMALVTLACIVPQPNHIKVLKNMLKEEDEEKKVDLNNLQGFNPVLVAMKNNNYTAVKILMHYGADFNIKDDDGEYLIHRIVEKDLWYLVRHILAFDNVDMSVLNKNGQDVKEHAELGYHDLVFEEIEKYEKRKSWGAIFSDEEKANYKGIDDLSDLQEIINENSDSELENLNEADDGLS